MGHGRSGAIPISGPHVLPRCRSCDRGIRHNEPRFFRRSQIVGEGTATPGRSQCGYCVGGEQGRSGIAEKGPLRGGQRLRRGEWHSAHGNVREERQQRQIFVCGNRQDAAQGSAGARAGGIPHYPSNRGDEKLLLELQCSAVVRLCVVCVGMEM